MSIEEGTTGAASPISDDCVQTYTASDCTLSHLNFDPKTLPSDLSPPTSHFILLCFLHTLCLSTVLRKVPCLNCGSGASCFMHLSELVLFNLVPSGESIGHQLA
ncbi:uncharacterized protein LOC114718951 [Neltuma alba]|uniref:uncharacterized protein LOC114718951 n=1 Tax=Neltuma alba TaxID=207710 RepID=UPI0010A33203|nr:uncharacterized protein LOC114718951 [Prosopis alba]